MSHPQSQIMAVFKCYVIWQNMFRKKLGMTRAALASHRTWHNTGLKAAGHLLSNYSVSGSSTELQTTHNHREQGFFLSFQKEIQLNSNAFFTVCSIEINSFQIPQWILWDYDYETDKQFRSFASEWDTVSGLCRVMIHTQGENDLGFTQLCRVGNNMKSGSLQ